MGRCKELNGWDVPLNQADISDKQYEKSKKYHMRLLKHAITGRIDIETDACCMRGFGTVKERKFYRQKWEEAYTEQKEYFISTHRDSGRPEFYEMMGYTKEEYEDLKNV